MDCKNTPFYRGFHLAQHIQFQYDKQHLKATPEEHSKVSALVAAGTSFNEAVEYVLDEHIESVADTAGKSLENVIGLYVHWSGVLAKNGFWFCFGGWLPLPRVLHEGEWIAGETKNNTLVERLCGELFGELKDKALDLIRIISDDCNKSNLIVPMGTTSSLLVSQHYLQTKGMEFTGFA